MAKVEASYIYIYLDATSIEEPRKRKATLLHFGGLGLQEIFYNLPGANVDVPDDLGNDIFEIAISKLDEYFAPKQSKVYERHLFRLVKPIEVDFHGVNYLLIIYSGY